MRVRALQKCYIGEALRNVGAEFDLDISVKDLPKDVLIQVKDTKARRKPERPSPDSADDDTGDDDKKS